ACRESRNSPGSSRSSSDWTTRSSVARAALKAIDGPTSNVWGRKRTPGPHDRDRRHAAPTMTTPRCPLADIELAIGRLPRARAASIRGAAAWAAAHAANMNGRPDQRADSAWHAVTEQTRHAPRLTRPAVVPPKSWRVSYAASGLVLDSLIS